MLGVTVFHKTQVSEIEYPFTQSAVARAVWWLAALPFLWQQTS